MALSVAEGGRSRHNSAMAAGKSDLHWAAALIGSCLMLAGCEQARQPTLSYTSPPGSVDVRPDPLWGEPYPYMPPEPDGRSFDPTHGRGTQKYADRLIGRRIADFVAHRWDMLRSGTEISDFFPAAQAGPGPGMCEARRYQITGGISRSRVVRTSDGQWLPPVYAVAGSLAPVPEARAKGYGRRLEQACRERTEMEMWFSAEPDRAYLGAHLADAVVAAARQQGSLPFRLRCTPYPPDVHYKPQCAADVRRTSASINPRAILEVRECYDKLTSDCVSVEIAKVPERSTTIEERWTLDITFDRTDGLRIEEVDLADTQLIIELSSTFHPLRT